MRIFILVLGMLFVSFYLSKSLPDPRHRTKPIGYLVCVKPDGSVDSYKFDGKVVDNEPPTSVKLRASFKDMGGDNNDNTLVCVMKYKNK